MIPTPDRQFVLLDAGANIECTAVNLMHYAVMGSVYAREALGYTSPRVGILSIGKDGIVSGASSSSVWRPHASNWDLSSDVHLVNS